MATRRMRIKATINVPRGGPKIEPQSVPSPASSSLDKAHLTNSSVASPSSAIENKILSPAALPPTSPFPPSPISITSPSPISPATPIAPGSSGSIGDHAGGGGLELPFSPGAPPRINTPPVVMPPYSSPHSPAPSHSLGLVSWQPHHQQQLQRPPPSKSPAGLPPSGSVIRRSPSPALARLTNSPAPTSIAAPPSPTFFRVTSSPGPPPASPSSSLVLAKIMNSPVPSMHSPSLPKKRALMSEQESASREKETQQNPTKFAAARKEFFDKLHSGQAPERNKLTMLHFTFYNPPDPNKKTLPGQRKSRSRASSMCSDMSTVSKQEPQDGMNPPNNDKVGKASSAPSSIAGSRRTTASSTTSQPASEGGQSEAGSVASNGSSNSSVPGPRVKVGPDGKLIIDEKSLVMETSESQRARKQIEDMEVVSGADYAVGSSGFYRYKKSYRRGNEWTERETVRFYRALNQCGTDFSMMQKLFPFRTRHELKSKFKREDRKNPDLISKVLSSCVFDPDEGISSDEETPGKDLAAEKEKLIERNEVEQVVCCSKQVATVGKRKRTLKIKKEEKDMKFTTEQLEEMKSNLHKGKGTGKGRKWNAPVEGLVGGKLPSTSQLSIINEVKE